METRLRVKPQPQPPEKQEVRFRVPLLTTFQSYLAANGSISHQAEVNEWTDKTALGGENAILGVSARLGG